MMIASFLCSILLSSGIVSIPVSEQEASSHSYGVDDIRPTIHTLLSEHLEKKKVTKELLKSTCQNFIDKFDPQKIYFLQSEVDAHTKNQFIQNAFEQYQKGQFDFFLDLVNCTQAAISRARKIRSTGKLEGKIPNYAEVSGYAKTVDELRIRQQMAVAEAMQKQFPQKNSQGQICLATDQIEKAFEEREHEYALLEYKEKEAQEGQFARLFLQAFASSLDAHTSIFTPKEAEQFRRTLDKQVEGVGITVALESNGYIVNAILKGSPADLSGKIQLRDQLVSVNGQAINALSLGSVQALIDGEEGSSVHISLKRGNEIDDITLTCAKFESLEGRVQITTFPFQDGVLAYILLPSFYGSGESVSCADDLKKGLLNVMSQRKVLGVILDLRQNRGGYLHEAVQVAGLFITSGVVVRAKYFDGKIRTFRDIDPSCIYSGPFIVLTSRMTASAAEIVAEALKEYGVALVVGDEHTFGKGSIQYETASDDSSQPGAKADAGFKVTVGRYYSPKGMSTQLRGVEADIVVPGPWGYEKIGETFLKGALSGDSIDSSFNDTLEDVASDKQRWYKNHYLSFLQKPKAQSLEMIEQLQSASLKRIAQNTQYHELIDHMKKERCSEAGQQQVFSLQSQEALSILKDYVRYQQKSFSQERKMVSEKKSA